MSSLSRLKSYSIANPEEDLYENEDETSKGNFIIQLVIDRTGFTPDRTVQQKSFTDSTFYQTEH